MPNRQAVRLQLRVERGTIDARLDPRRARDLVDLDDFVQMHQIDRHRAAITVTFGRLDAANHARAAAIWHRRNLGAVAPFEHANQFFLIARKRDHVDRIRIIAPERPSDIPRPLAVVCPARSCVAVEQIASSAAGGFTRGARRFSSLSFGGGASSSGPSPNRLAIRSAICFCCSGSAPGPRSPIPRTFACDSRPSIVLVICDVADCRDSALVRAREGKQ